MRLVPSFLLKQLYNIGSLHNQADGIQFSLKNRLTDTKLTEILSLKIDGKDISLAQVRVEVDSDTFLDPSEISPKKVLEFPLKKVVKVWVNNFPLDDGKHKLEIQFMTKPHGKFKLKVEDVLSPLSQEPDQPQDRIPRDDENDYKEAVIAERQKYIQEYTGKTFQHIWQYSFASKQVAGNCESFSGVAQVPIGIAGPLQVNGEHAQGEFIIPLATTEGTLVASYNRGMKLINENGGVQCTVVEDFMQRAPVFVFENARQARDFRDWVKKQESHIRREAESTSNYARLMHIEYYLSNKFAFLRFNYQTGDAAGQNMVGKATLIACEWIIDNYPSPHIKHFYLESNIATEKKASQINTIRTRGKRVIAECVIKKETVLQHMRVEPELMVYHAQIANIATFLAGSNNNALHSANALAALFIATGQDVANLSESSTALIHSELTEEGDVDVSITIPSLIVATYGGGTGLATQKECLEMLDCYGEGKVYKFAEIVAAVVMAGELSLASAISASDWVASHEKYGRNR
ncbi:MAG: hydroxymethylglutaryl-CoA reductase [Bacteroidota bacterium]